MRTAIVVAFGALVTASSVAHADFRDDVEKFQGGAWLHYELTGLGVIDEGDTPARAHDLVLAGARLHGYLGQNASVAYHVGLDLAAGSTIDRAGFAYDVALFPVGVVVRAGRTSFVGASIGIGASGATRVLDDAMTIPLEAFAEAGGGRLRFLARVRASYIAFADARQSAAPSIAFADELEAMVALRIGHHFEDHDFPTGNGGFYGVSYKEMATSRMVGLTIGYSIDLATPRRWVDAERAKAEQRKERMRRERHERLRRRRPV